jgi:hypothetical protein
MMLNVIIINPLRIQKDKGRCYTNSVKEPNLSKSEI